MEVEYLTMNNIENSVLNLLNRFGENFTSVNAQPVPVDDICEKLLRLDSVPGNLPFDFPEKEFGHAIGALDVEENIVYVDRLENASFKRFRFTIFVYFLNYPNRIQ